MEYISVSQLGKGVNSSDSNSVLDILTENSDDFKFRQLSFDLLTEGIAFSNTKSFELQMELDQKMQDCEKSLGNLIILLIGVE